LRANELSSQYFLYFALDEEELRCLNTNSAQPGLNQASMRSFEIVIPPKLMITKFDKEVEPLVDKILYNAKQIQTLEKLRDTLLPKLISGAIRVNYKENE
jgi:type I restriction enzyme S subunit